MFKYFYSVNYSLEPFNHKQLERETSSCFFLVSCFRNHTFAFKEKCPRAPNSLNIIFDDIRFE